MTKLNEKKLLEIALGELKANISTGISCLPRICCSNQDKITSAAQLMFV
jgi:hypothetical protein